MCLLDKIIRTKSGMANREDISGLLRDTYSVPAGPAAIRKKIGNPV
jgi:hypothetical protein